MAETIVSLLVVNWNTREHLAHCLGAVRHCLERRAETIVVDNGSEDGSQSLVLTQFANAVLIENRHNTGFAYANNQAYAASNGRYILLLNSDAVLLPGSTEKMMAWLEEHPRSGGVVGRYLYPDGSFQHFYNGFPTIRAAAALWTWVGRVWAFRRAVAAYTLEGEDFSRPRTIPQPAASCLLLRREAIEDAGGLFDEQFPILMNDVDLCRRLWDAGWEIHYIPDAPVIHYKSKSVERLPDHWKAHYFAGFLRYLRKHRGLGPALLMWGILAIHGLLAVGAAAVRSVWRRGAWAEFRSRYGWLRSALAWRVPALPGGTPTAKGSTQAEGRVATSPMSGIAEPQSSNCDEGRGR